ncbi:MAG: adenylyl-sulfate kinase [Archaeoglobus sp.]|nr:adenylyl-sulfate kinase [Archaeoglobus sp.]
MFVVWLTGPSGAGKTTLANALAKRLKELGHEVEILDGDGIRSKLYPDLGFSKEEREMHNKVVIEMAKLLAKNDVSTIVSIISPFKSTRDYARKEIDNFIEVYLKCSKEELIKRDPKGLYAKALKGEIKDLTGYDGTYEEPENPEVLLETDKLSVDEEVSILLKYLEDRGFIKSKLLKD